MCKYSVLSKQCTVKWIFCDSQTGLVRHAAFIAYESYCVLHSPKAQLQASNFSVYAVTKTSYVQVHFLGNHCTGKWDFGDTLMVYNMSDTLLLILLGVLEA